VSQNKKSLIFLDQSILFILIITFVGSCLHFKQVESTSIESEKPFWIPYRLNVGEDYFKINVFMLGIKEDTGLIKICVTSIFHGSHLCHYMDAYEEGQIIRPFVSVHGGIFVFPSNQVPENSSIDICVTLMSYDVKSCKTVINTSANTEELVDIDVR
jgi:hypothetical protein